MANRRAVFTLLLLAFLAPLVAGQAPALELTPVVNSHGISTPALAAENMSAVNATIERVTLAIPDPDNLAGHYVTCGAATVGSLQFFDQGAFGQNLDLCVELGDNSGNYGNVIIGTSLDVPSTSSSACLPGQTAASSSFFYVCASVNSWRRVAISAW